MTDNRITRSMLDNPHECWMFILLKTTMGLLYSRTKFAIGKLKSQQINEFFALFLKIPFQPEL